MSSLKDQILKQQGQLAQTSSEELAKMQGRTSAPLQPLETSVLGGNEDQAKMAGTPNQKLSALRSNVQQSLTLSDYQRKDRPQATSDQKSQQSLMQAQLEQLEGLGQLQNRVKQMALRRFTNEVEGPGQLEVTGEQLEGLDTGIISRLQSGQATSTDLLAAAEQLGITEVNNVGQLGAQLMEQLGVDSSVQSEWLASLAEGSLTLSELNQDDLTALGFTNAAELATTLGLSEEEVGQLTLEGLEDLVDRKQAEQFDQTRELRNVLRDPTSTPAQREAARAQLGQLQAAGVDDVELQFENLERAVEKGQTVQFDGEQLSVSELLSSEGLELRIAQALSSPEALEELRELEKKFAEFIEDNQQAFALLVDEVDADVDAFAQLQQDNLSIAQPDPKVPSFSDSIMEEWYDDWGSLRAEGYQPNGVIQLMQDPSVDRETKEILQQSVDTLSKRGYSDDVRYLGSLSPEQINKLGLTDARKMTQYLDARQETERLDDYTGDAFIEQAFGDPNKLQDRVEELTALVQSGFGKTNEVHLNILDSNKDGKLDDWKSIKQRLLDSRTSLEDLAGSSVDSYKNPLQSRREADKLGSFRSSSPIFDLIKDEFSDGKVRGQSEGRRVASKIDDSGDLYTLYSMNSPGMDGNARWAIKKELESRASTFSNNQFVKASKKEGRPPILYGVDGKKPKVESVTDLIRVRAQLTNKIKQNAKLGTWNEADGGWERNKENQVMRERLDVLARYADWMEGQLNSKTGNPIERARVNKDKKRLSSFRNW